MSRRIQAPGIEVNEIDRSGYTSTDDNSTTGTTVHLFGFADKGYDYSTMYINTMDTFTNIYGYPKTEAERYFYNGAYEVISRGGNLYSSKLPYDNDSLDKYAYTSYEVINNLCTDVEYLSSVDGTLLSYVEIKACPVDNHKRSGYMELNLLDKYKTGEARPSVDHITVVDISRKRYGNDKFYKDKEYIGILPVITTAANALYYQNYIDKSECDDISQLRNKYAVLKDIKTIPHKVTREDYKEEEINKELSNLNNESEGIIGFTRNLGSESKITEDEITYSDDAAGLFPNIGFKNGAVERDYLKNIGVVVFQMFVDESNDNKVSMTPVEAFCGSLNRYEESKTSSLIDKVVNDNSKYINLFSNVQFSNNPRVKKFPTD